MADAVTHTLKSVRRHTVALRLPEAPAENEEAFVIDIVGRGHGGGLKLSPGDFLTLIGTLGKVWKDVTGDELRTESELRARPFTQVGGVHR